MSDAELIDITWRAMNREIRTELRVVQDEASLKTMVSTSGLQAIPPEYTEWIGRQIINRT